MKSSLYTFSLFYVLVDDLEANISSVDALRDLRASLQTKKGVINHIIVIFIILMFKFILLAGMLLNFYFIIFIILIFKFVLVAWTLMLSYGFYIDLVGRFNPIQTEFLGLWKARVLLSHFVFDIHLSFEKKKKKDIGATSIRWMDVERSYFGVRTKSDCKFAWGI